MLTFIIESIKLDYPTLHRFIKGMISPILILLNVLETLRIDVSM